MKAVYFDDHGALDVLKYGDVPEPVLGRGEVLLRVEAAACNFNDIWARRGLPRVELPLPHISGTDAAGVVVEIGPEAYGVKIGDKVITYPVNSCRACVACLAGQEVFCRSMKIWGFQTGPYDGSYAQYAKVQAAQVQPMPEHLSWHEAAAITTSLLSVWRMLVTRARVQPGDTVLVWGASGGTGSYALQLLNVMGARAIAVTTSRVKAEFCERMGAAHVILSNQQDVLSEVRSITHNRGVDVVFDHVGQTTWATGIECLRWGGTIVICGATEGHLAQTDLRYLWNKQLNLLGSHIGTHREWVQALQLVHARKIQPPVESVYALADLKEAQHSMESRSIMGKVVIQVS